MSAVTVPRTRPERFRVAFSDALTMTRRHLRYWWRSPEEVVGALAFPLVSVLLFGYVFGSAMAVPGGADYKEYLLPGLFGMTMVFGLVNTVAAVVADRERGVTDRFLAMPVATSSILAGRAAADLVRAVADLVVLIGCGHLVGWRWHQGTAAALAAVGLLLLLRFALIWAGIYVGLVLRSPDAAAVLYPLVLPFAMIANTFVPPALMPGWLGAVAEANPMSATVAATRELFGNPSVPGGSWLDEYAVPLAVGWPLLLLVLFVPLAVRRYRRAGR